MPIKYRKLTLEGLGYLNSWISEVLEQESDKVDYCNKEMNQEVVLAAIKLLGRIQIRSTCEGLAFHDCYTVREEIVERVISLHSRTIYSSQNLDVIINKKTIGFFEV